MIRVGDIFDVSYGQSLELNKLKESHDGINFISRTAKSNGVSSRVEEIDGILPLPAGTLTVALGGSVLETFLQPEPYYTGFHIYCLTPKEEMTDAQKLFYCACLRANKYRYNYGRQANRTLKDILVPKVSEIPAWVSTADAHQYDGADASLILDAPPKLHPAKWKPFKLSELFDLKKGKRLTKADMKPGDVPFIGAIDNNNGLTAFVAQEALHPAGTITVNYNGNGVADSYYQPVPFRCTDDVNVLYPKFEMTPAVALFIATVIRKEKYRFSYGRKWGLERMKVSIIKLPIAKGGVPDWNYMETYIKTLPFSAQI